MKTYKIAGKEFTLKAVKLLSFKEDQLVRELFINENIPFSEIDLNKVFPVILLPAAKFLLADFDYTAVTFETFSEIVTDFLSERQIFFLHLPGSIAASVQQNLKSTLNLTPAPESPGASNQT